MKTRDIIFESRKYSGSVAPPATMEDISRWGNDGVFTNAPTLTKLPSDFWYLAFVAASTQLVTIGDINSVARAIEFWLSPDSTTESILEEVAATGISINAGAMQYPSWDDCYIDGANTDTITTGWHHVVITSTTNVVMTAFRLGLVNITYLDGFIASVIVYSYEPSAGQVAQKYEESRRWFGK